MHWISQRIGHHDSDFAMILSIINNMSHQSTALLGKALLWLKLKVILRKICHS